jgi:vacuolar-type H+-ATPase subunit H
MIDPSMNEAGSTDVLYLLERLEEVLGAGSHLPLTSRALIDDEECFAIIDQIRLSLPNEIRRARMVNSERDALLNEARAQADQMLRSADNDARERVKEHYIARQAESHAEEIMATAQREATQVRSEADEYSYRVLLDLDQRLEGLVTTVRNGIEALEQRRDAASSSPQESTAERSSGRWSEP